MKWACVFFILVVFCGLTGFSLFDILFYKRVPCDINDISTIRDSIGHDYNHIAVVIALPHLRNSDGKYQTTIKYTVDCGCSESVCQGDCYADAFQELEASIGNTVSCNQYWEVSSIFFSHSFWFLSENPRLPSIPEYLLYSATFFFFILIAGTAILTFREKLVRAGNVAAFYPETASAPDVSSEV